MKENKRLRKNKQATPAKVDRATLNQAMKEYLAQGGTIKNIQPLWIEEGSLFPSNQQ